MAVSAPTSDVDVLVIGAGAAGLMCALTAGQRGRRVAVLDHANKVGKKILMSGGGRCNFTNMYTQPTNFLSNNPHFCKSALSRYSPQDFVDLVEQHRIPYHEKKLGQLFCDHKSRDILNLLLTECEAVGVEIRTLCQIERIRRSDQEYVLETSLGRWSAPSLVIASGGLSIPKMGASGFGYQVARQFGLRVLATRAGLVPFSLDPAVLAEFDGLSGTSADSAVWHAQDHFREHLLFTHRGLSGPAILQISSYWSPGDHVTINLLPQIDVSDCLKQARRDRPNSSIQSILAQWMTRKLADRLMALWCPDLQTIAMGQQSDANLQRIDAALTRWRLKPNGTEGYRTAEVTLGGVDTDQLSSKTFECHAVSGLYFIGEVLDVTGHLGGYNFQWAWASGRAAGQVV